MQKCKKMGEISDFFSNLMKKVILDKNDKKVKT